MIEKLILARLVNLTDLGGNPIQVHHQKTPQNESANGVVFRNISTQTVYCKGGNAAQDNVRFQFDIYHTLDTEVANLQIQIRTQLEGWTGTFSTVRYNYTTLENQFKSYDEKLNLHRGIMDFVFRKTM
jgi:hypothetical protein